MEQELQDVVEALEMLEHDEGVPKNIRSKIIDIKKKLQDNCEISLKVNQCLQELDEIAEDINLQTFIRTQIWNVSSLLEKVNH
ncbi:hypothetical protein C4573_05095 [Candidatus Woesearchaeota archaeon]|nr:MAG: hypothetical protein C4573_05095 [Candidatus Woesearchaeota archaeon]